MITSLSIENFVLIEKLDITFAKGFSVITGETGAGKSILLGALGLLQGKRADFSVLKNQEKKCIVEAVFDVGNHSLQPFFQENEIEYERETIVRREILASGRSRAFINDTLVTLPQLQTFASFLIDIHSQHQNASLLDENFQMEVLDYAAATTSLLDQYATVFKDCKAQKKQLQLLVSDRNTQLKELDYNQFLLQELEKLPLKDLDLVGIEEELERLNHVEQIKEVLYKTSALIQEEQVGISSSLNELKSGLSKIAKFSSHYQDMAERIQSLWIEVKDIATEVDLANENLVYDAARISYLNDLLQQLYPLLRKHQVTTIPELLAVQDELSRKVNSLVQVDTNIEVLQKEIHNKELFLNTLAFEIFEKRIAEVPQLEHKLASILQQLGMPHARFKIVLTESLDLLHNGKHHVEILFAANKGTAFGSLKKTASGGEMSRIMLAIKSILAQTKKLPTLLLDEIDTGISGEVATKMAEIMQTMSANMQLFAITHLPQIAAKGTIHYKVQKLENKESAISELIVLSPNDRVMEIAEMISGKNPSDSAVAHAKALLH